MVRPRARRGRTGQGSARQSSARQIPVAMSAGQGAATSWLRGIRLSGFSFVMMGLLILAVVVLAPTLREFIAQHEQIVDLQASVAAQKAKVSKLEAERARWNDPSYIRAQARERLYYVMPGDISYLVIDDGKPTAAQKAANPISKKIQSTKTNWLDSLFTATMTAGLSTQSAKQLTGQ